MPEDWSRKILENQEILKKPQVWMSTQKLNFGNSCQKARKNRYQRSLPPPLPPANFSPVPNIPRKTVVTPNRCTIPTKSRLTGKNAEKSNLAWANFVSLPICFYKVFEKLYVILYHLYNVKNVKTPMKEY